MFSCEFCKISKNTFCYRAPPVAASEYCRRKVAAVKIENLKAFIIKYYDISKFYSLQFHLFYSVKLSYFYFFIHGFQSSVLHGFLKNSNRHQQSIEVCLLREGHRKFICKRTETDGVKELLILHVIVQKKKKEQNLISETACLNLCVTL